MLDNGEEMEAIEMREAPPVLISPDRPKQRLLFIGVFTYIVLVLGIDSLATLQVDWPFAWNAFQWFPYRILPPLEALQDKLGLPIWLTGWLGAAPLRSFDFFKFLFWFLLPFLCCVRWMDWSAFGVKRWERNDKFILMGLAGLGLAAMFLIPLFPTLQEQYPEAGHLTADAKLAFIAQQLVWVFSWLVGWEFLHRYALLRSAEQLWPRVGWLLVPLSEGLYHLQKPGLETIGMVIFSIILTRWSLARWNLLLPLLAHLIIEVELILFLVLI